MDYKNYLWHKTSENHCSVLVLSMGSKHMAVNGQNKAVCCSSLYHTIPVTRLSRMCMDILERFPRKFSIQLNVYLYVNIYYYKQGFVVDIVGGLKAQNSVPCLPMVLCCSYRYKIFKEECEITYVGIIYQVLSSI